MRQPAHTFEIILKLPAPGKPIALRSTSDPNQATMAFHTELQRLKQERTEGELIVVQHGGQEQAVLRLPLVNPAGIT